MEYDGAQAQGGEAPLGLSIILPIYEEEESIPSLINELHEALRPTGRSYELICVDDGSQDKSVAVLRALAADDPALVVIELRRNFGQTAAMQAGLDAARQGDLRAGADLGRPHRALHVDPALLGDDGPGLDGP